MPKDNAVIVKDLYKSFRIPLDKASGIKQLLINFHKRNKGYRDFHVLNDINFEIQKGEFFGIVGRNGSGKSTLLKLLAGIYTPDKGLVHISGSLTPFIELGVGFNPELTAHENVYLNGALLGFSRDEINEMYAEIVEFAELKDFMAEKLKNFSSGMQVRLAFSIAIRARSEILIMDEVLAVGDSDFQKKCFNAFRELKTQGRTIILVTHDMGNVQRFCDRVLILDKGEILTITSPSEASLLYDRLNISEREIQKSNISPANDQNSRFGSGEVRVEDITITNSKGDENVFNTDDAVSIKIDLKRQQGYDKEAIIGLAIHNEDGLPILGPNNENDPITKSAKSATISFKKLALKPGQYSLTVIVYEKETLSRLDVLDNWVHFSVISDRLIGGLFDVDYKWSQK